VHSLLGLCPRLPLNLIFAADTVDTEPVRPHTAVYQKKKKKNCVVYPWRVIREFLTILSQFGVYHLDSNSEISGEKEISADPQIVTPDKAKS
jgi:hypothetical protein